MSSYLNFYIVPKSNEVQGAKPLLLTSYSRNTDIYQKFYEETHPVFIGNGDKPNYTELSTELMNDIINSARKDWDKAQQSYASRMDAYKSVKLDSEAFDKYVEDVTSTEEYLKELKQLVTYLEAIADIVNDTSLGCTDFEKVLINID